MAKDKIDDFWNIESLVPARKKPTPRPTVNVSSVEVVIPSDEKLKNDNKLTLTRPAKPAEKSDVFVQYSDFTPLVKNVCVYNWNVEYNYYELFKKQALHYRKAVAKKCNHEHFFSYMPQYSQMSSAQLEWYLWWRQSVNNGVYPDTDYPYILLYVFELINLSDKNNAADSLDIMIDLWSNYHEIYPQLNKTLGDWICDFSLVYQLQIKFPDERITHEMMCNTGVPELFYNFDFDNKELLAKFLLSYCNSYNYRKSKFYDEKTKELFETHVLGAIRHVLDGGELNKHLFAGSEKKISKISFMGALCTFEAKKKIELTYVSLALETELKAIVSNLTKHVENKIRALCGVRSKLGVKYVDAKIQRFVDEYFSICFGKNYGAFVVQPEYEKLYEAKNEVLSVDLANKIEQSSWGITQKLVEAFEEENTETEITEPEILPIKATEQENEISDGSSNNRSTLLLKIPEYVELFKLVEQRNGQEQLKFAKAHQLILEAVIDEINEISADLFGDILIEEDDIGYKIIDDYTELLECEV